MSRTLSQKAAAALLKKAFSEKGAKLSHHEALDLLAKLQGFEAWSHRKSEHSAAPLKAFAPDPGCDESPLERLLREHFESKGPNVDCSQFSRTQHARSSPHVPPRYWAWVAERLVATRELPALDFPDFEVEPVLVTEPDGWQSAWLIEQNLTDRWGELNDHDFASKPGLVLLHADPELLARCRQGMWDDITFVVRKNGRFGVLFEVEYECLESEQGPVDAASNQPPREQVVVALLDEARALELEHREVDFCVPPASQVVMGRAALWAFVPLQTLGEQGRENLGRALLGLVHQSY